MFTAEPITCELKLRPVPAPVLDDEAALALREAEAEIAASPQLFDGPQLMGLNAHDGELPSYCGRYAHLRAALRLGRPSALGAGAIGVGVSITDSQGRELWCQRAMTVLDGGAWSYGVAGGVVPGQTIREAALAELEEELGIRDEDILSLEPLLLLRGRGQAAFTFYRAQVADGFVPSPDPTEVADTRWVCDPEAELEPLLPLGMDVWRIAVEYGAAGMALPPR